MDRFSQLFSDVGALLDAYGMAYLQDMGNTLGLAVVATVLGFIIGLACGILNTIPCSKNDSAAKRVLLKVVRAIVRIYVEVFRGTPMILQAVFIFYGLPYFTNNAYHFESIWAASILIVSINTGAYMAESVRGGIISIDPGQTEGAKSIGMNHFQTMTSVILPQAIRNIMPQIGNNFIINVKDTSVMFIIGFTEFFARHRYITGVNNMYFPSARYRDGRLPHRHAHRVHPPALARAAHGRQLRATSSSRRGQPHHDRRHLQPPRPRHALRRAQRRVRRRRGGARADTHSAQKPQRQHERRQINERRHT